MTLCSYVVTFTGPKHMSYKARAMIHSESLHCTTEKMEKTRRKACKMSRQAANEKIGGIEHFVNYSRTRLFSSYPACLDCTVLDYFAVCRLSEAFYLRGSLHHQSASSVSTPHSSLLLLLLLLFLSLSSSFNLSILVELGSIELAVWYSASSTF